MGLSVFLSISSVHTLCLHLTTVKAPALTLIRGIGQLYPQLYNREGLPRTLKNTISRPSS